MDKRNTGEDSPFYEKYGGTTKKTKTYGYHVKKDFQKPLKEFFDVRFGADATDNEIMEQIVSDYYFRYAHERTYYPRTIVALIHKTEIGKDNPIIYPMLIYDGYAKSDNGDLNLDNETKNMVSFQFHAHTCWYKDAGADIKDAIIKRLFNDGYAIQKLKVFDTLRNLDENKLNDFVVIEFALNNYFDVKQNGVYGYLQENGELKENQHVGVVIANTHSEIADAEPFTILYNWKLDLDFGIELLDIVKLSESDLAKCIDNYNMGLVVVLRPILNFNYSLEKKLEEKDRLINELKAMLEDQEQERLKLVDAIEKKKSKNFDYEVDMLKKWVTDGSDEN